MKSIKPTKKITIDEMADKAGVSTATISRAMNPATRSRVAPDTLSLIEKLASKYHYRPNLAAQRLAGNSVKTIGVLFPHLPQIFLGHYHTKVLAGVSDALLESEYGFKLILTRPERATHDLAHLQSTESVDGIVVAYLPVFKRSKSALNKIGIPCAIVNDWDDALNAHFVSCNNEEIGKEAAKQFVEAGHKEIAIFTGLSNSSDSRQRLKGFKKYLSEVGINLASDRIVKADYEKDIAIEKTIELFKPRRRKITGIFCCNDYMAFGVLEGLKSLGLSCPNDVSLIGCDNEDEGAYGEVRLSTFDIPIYEMAKKAALSLLNHLKKEAESSSENDNSTLKTYYKSKSILPYKFIQRNSVAKIRR